MPSTRPGRHDLLRDGQIVESRDHDRIYFASAEIYGGDLGDDAELSTWATTSIGGAEAIWTVDDVAKKHSDLRDGTKAAGVSMSDDGAEESRDCLGQWSDADANPPGTLARVQLEARRGAWRSSHVQIVNGGVGG